MTRNAVIDELNRYLRTPPITFEKGIMQTDNDNVLGFVSDLKNMDVKNNHVERRKGSRFLSDPLITNKFILLEELVICGAKILVGITEKREVFAFTDKWVETQFPIYKKGMFHLPNNDSFKLDFQRGEKFWLLEDNKYYRIVNDFGDAYRINKQGYIQFMSVTAEVDDLTKFRPAQQQYDSRYDNTDEDYTGIGLFLDVEDITLEDAPEMYFIDDHSSATPEIRGDVRVAHVNNAGHRGLWSDPVFLSDWKSTYISKMEGSYIGYNKDLDLMFSSSSGGIITKSDGINRYLKPTPTTSISGSWTIFDHTYIIAEDSFQNATIWEKNVSMVFDKANKRVYFYFDSASSSLDLTTAITDTFIQFTDIRFLNDEDGSGATLQVVGYPKREESFDMICTLEGLKPSSTIPTTYTSKVSNVIEVATSTASKQWFSIKLNDFNYNAYVEATADVDYEIDMKEGSTYYFQDLIGGVATATIKLIANGSDWNLAKSCFELDSGDLSLMEASVFYKCRGLDLWEKVDSLSEPPDPVAFDNQNIYYDLIGSAQEELIAVPDEGLLDACKDRFAVWNDGFIKGTSQKFMSDTGDNPLYDYTDTVTKSYDKDNLGLTGRVVNQPPLQPKLGHMPIISMRDTKISRRFHKLNFFEEIIRDPQHVATNAGVLFVVQGARIWLGNIDSMLLTGNIDIDFTVEHMQPLYNGVLLFTNKGLKLLDGRGGISSVNVSGINSDRFRATVSGAAGVFAVSTEEEVVFVHMIFNGDARPYAKADSLSGATYAIQWSGDPQMKFIKDTLWIARDYDVWGFRAGGWKSKHVFEQKINRISSFHNELVISFYGEPKVDDLDYETLEYGGAY